MRADARCASMAGAVSAEVGQKRKHSRDFIQSLDRGLTVIRAFSSNTPALTVGDIAAATRLSRASIRRSLLTLAELGYVERNGHFFLLRPKVLDLGYSYISSSTLPDIALPHVERLVGQVTDSSEAAVLDNEEVVYVLRVPGVRIVTTAVSVGSRMPAHATALGKMLLALLDQDDLDKYLDREAFASYTPQTITDPAALREQLALSRSRGWAASEQELEHGLRAVAVPVKGAGGTVAGALNVSSSTVLRSREAMETEVLPPLLEAAGRIEADLQTTMRSHPPLRKVAAETGRE